MNGCGENQQTQSAYCVHSFMMMKLATHDGITTNMARLLRSHCSYYYCFQRKMAKTFTNLRRATNYGELKLFIDNSTPRVNGGINNQIRPVQCNWNDDDDTHSFGSHQLKMGKKSLRACQ